MALIGATDLDVSPLCFGGNVFGWTVDEPAARELLDRFVASGGNFIDTANVYSAWADGNSGGESETIIGKWMADRGRRDDVVVATKVGLPLHGDVGGLRRGDVLRRVEGCLRRLRTDHLDLLFAHRDDPDTPLEETLEAFDHLVRSGKVRHVAASNFTSDRLATALAASDADDLVQFCALETPYSLLSREFEGALASLCLDEGLSALPYFALEKGFLTGKYRPGTPPPTGPRAERHRPQQYLDERGVRILEALDEVAEYRGTSVASVALAWVLAHPAVTSVLASARTEEQLDELVPVMELALADEEIARITDASS